MVFALHILETSRKTSFAISKFHCFKDVFSHLYLKIVIFKIQHMSNFYHVYYCTLQPTIYLAYSMYLGSFGLDGLWTTNLFLSVLEAGKYKIKEPADWVSSEVLFLIHREPSSHHVLIWWKGWRSSLESFLKRHSHSGGLHPPDLIIHKGPTF